MMRADVRWQASQLAHGALPMDRDAEARQANDGRMRLSRGNRAARFDRHRSAARHLVADSNPGNPWPKELEMPTHLLVSQLHFARAEFVRCMEGVGEEEARRRILLLNCLSWMVGHLADQENRYWVLVAQSRTLHPELNALVGYGQPASTPPPDDMWSAWRGITAAADVFLEGLTPQLLQSHLEREGRPVRESIGTMLLRNIYHYWYHIGESQAVRQMLGHHDLPEFVGDMSSAFYRPEGSEG
jgi:hypothetical protein